MKKQYLCSLVFIMALMAISMVFAPAVFAGNSTHTITVTNNSDTDLIPVNNSHRVTYNSANSACAAVPPDACTQLSMTPPSSIPANSSATISMTGPTGCNVSMWQTYWKPGKAGKYGEIACSKSPVNVCNSVSKNYTCTISQTNVNSSKNGTSVSGSVQ